MGESRPGWRPVADRRQGLIETKQEKDKKNHGKSAHNKAEEICCGVHGLNERDTCGDRGRLQRKIGPSTGAPTT